MTDIRVENHGSIVVLRPVSRTGQTWVQENLGPVAESWQWLGDGLCIEPRFVADIVQGAIADGLEVR